MSDFDKEAEREKLREKYEQEEEKREATEQMSELLLKGATMTNAHCSDCGDPIFRYDGQEFCPTCQKPVDREADERAGGTADETPGEDAAESDASAGTNGDGGDDRIEVTTPSDDANVQFGGDDERTEPTADERGESTADERTELTADAQQRTPTATDAARSPEPDRSTDDVGDVRSVPSAAPNRSPAPDQGSATPAADSTGGRTGGSASEHLGRAQTVLARTVERYAELAAAADSPRETRDHLETAREAAETLDATEF